MTSGKPTPESLPKEPLPRLLAVMAWLRDRQHGCPWDKAECRSEAASGCREHVVAWIDEQP